MKCTQAKVRRDEKGVVKYVAENTRNIKWVDQEPFRAKRYWMKPCNILKVKWNAWWEKELVKCRSYLMLLNGSGERGVLRVRPPPRRFPI